MTTSLQEIAGRLMRCPAAPYHESTVAAEIIRICQEYRLPLKVDSFGNLLVELKSAPSRRPFVLAAHMDHPAFVIKRALTTRSWSAEFLGGVGDEYFKPGVPLRLYPGGVAARLGERLKKDKRIFSVEKTEDSKAKPQFGVWDLAEFEVRDGRIIGRACDDLIGVATVLHAMIELARTKAKVHVIGVLSRAEEVGFHGALALAQSKRLARNSLIISLETSRELPPVQMGKGVIIRVGDRASIFDSAGTRFLGEVAAEMMKERGGFQYQRALMSGGTCEATAYQEFGYRCAAVCVALGNYHNCAGNGKIEAEFVSVSDAQDMSALLRRAALEMKNHEKLAGRLPKRLAKYGREAIRQLRKKPLTVD